MWVQAISIAFTKTYALLNRSTAPGCGPELLHSTLLGVLQLVAGLSSRGQMGLAAELAGCCRYGPYINGYRYSLVQSRKAQSAKAQEVQRHASYNSSIPPDSTTLCIT